MPRRLPLVAVLVSLSALALLGCSGVVPRAKLAVNPSPATAGQPVTFDATGSENLLPAPNFDWDLDGDGVFEREGTADRVVQNTYPTPQQVTVSLRIRQGGNSCCIETGVASQPLTVRDPHIPTPSFTVSPNPACSTGTVTFNASGSSDVDGTIVRYDWDLDGDGSFETKTGTSPLANKSAYGAKLAQREIGLQVTDNDGRTAQTKRALVIDDSICRPSAAAAVSTAAVEHRARFALTLSAKAANRGISLVNGNRLTTSNFRAGGVVRLRGLPTPLQHVRRARWVARLSYSLNIRTHRERVQGEALLRLGRRGNLCTSLALTRAQGRNPRGKMKVLGGSGPARHIDGEAAYSGKAGLRGPLKVRGRIEMEQKRKGKGLTRACRALLRR